MFVFKNLEIVSYKYYGTSDLASNIFIKNLIENLDLIENNVDNINAPIIDQNDFYQYLWFLNFHKFILDINSFKIENGTVHRLLEIHKKIDYSPKRFILYMNFNYKIIFDRKKNEEIRWYEYFEEVLEICFNASNGINEEVFVYLENELPLDLLFNFSCCEKFYKKHKSRIPNLFKDLEKTRTFDDNIYVDFLLNQVNITDPYFIKQADFICSRSIAEIKKVRLDSDNQSTIQILGIFENYSKLANYYKLKCANEYNSFSEKLIEAKNEFLLKHGQHVQIGPVDLKPAIDMLKSSTDPYKFFQLTHKLIDEKYYNLLDDIFSVKKTSNLSELVQHIGNPRSDNYPYYKQDSMKINMWIQDGLINLIICDEELKTEFGNFIVTICHEVETKFFFNKIAISKELIGQYEILLNIVDLTYKKQETAPLYLALINGCVMNLCGLIEKLIRNIKLEEIKNIVYFDANSCTLASLLKDKIKSLSNGLQYYLTFYLCTENNNKSLGERPGKNMRNIQMHNHNLKYENTNWADCCNLFYFVISIISDLIILPYNKK